MSDSDFSISESFNGKVRLFPLPNLVLFPGVVQALNLFEPRYRQLMEDVLNDDGLITMALVKPEPENLAMPVPEIHKMVCVGKVMTHAKLENGTYNLLLAGVTRALIVEELSSDTPYRQAMVRLLPDQKNDLGDDQMIRSRLIELFKGTRDIESQFDEQALDKLVSDRIEVGQLADLIAYASGISPAEQQEILEMTNVKKRVEYLVSKLEQISQNMESDSGGSRNFPPDFSLN